jgi:outer membrane lipoprotein LolB
MTMRPIRRLLLAACAATLLAGCASAPPPSSEPVAPYREQIELSGRLSVNYQRDGKTESLAGRFSWRQSGAQTDVVLTSPLGQTVAQISVTPGLATLTQGGQPPRVAADIDSLSAETLGWPLPVSGLRDWLQGYATDAAGARFVASPRRDRATTRDGWRLHFVTWQDAPDGPVAAPRAGAPRPKRIDAERSADLQTEEVAIRIVLDPPETP